ncbi:lytic transglycosylase domain-containing protein [Clostridium folliculivorans]|uniref:Transglycosylase n=1 Tax=Clostridium folliculivorans TaxID=2886038 RepID=A0A9W5Y4K4_9CLOT|nr:lytic transglycosylase domain-containing protein [Clostridium folliculivorans]GKU26452.1 transglycosylase [Clostridium folliculivorans]GKU31993.1 transglycosylase [Clostridium folliculivorans]
MKIDNTEQMLGVQMLSTYMKQAMGNSPAFDMVMESLMKNLTEDNSSSNILNALTGGTSDNGNAVDQNVLAGTDLSKLGQTSVDSYDGDKQLDLNNLNPYSNAVLKLTSKGSSTSGTNMARIDNAVASASQKYGVNQDLIRAIIKQESGFNPYSVSGAGATGIMQIMPENFSGLGITDPFNIEQNINGGTQLLKGYLDKYNGNTEMALAAYNGGPGTMQRRGVGSSSEIYKMPRETVNYVGSVMNYFRNGV